MRKFAIVCASLILCTSGLLAQNSHTQSAAAAQGDVSQSVFSPFAHLVQTAPSPQPRVMLQPSICPIMQYYNPAGTQISFTQHLPTSRWAMKLSPPNTAVSVCTVWTILMNFEISGGISAKHDTMHVFVREVNPPYTEIFHTYFLAKLGTNYGYVEISPTIAPPMNTFAIMNPKRDLYVGYYLQGDTSRSATFYYITSASYSRSVAFTSNTTFVTASSVVGSSVDWVFDATLCCDFPITPVEMSLFEGTWESDRVALRWRTESERNNNVFEVQRGLSPDGPWETRGWVPGHGTTTDAHTYTFTDGVQSGLIADGSVPVLYYRLRQMDFDGTINVQEPISVMIADPLEAGFRMYQSYPNPLVTSQSPSTSIRYQVPIDTRVQMGVYDALGREVARLVDGVETAGVHEAQWYPLASQTGLRSGQYFVRMQAGDFSAVRTLTLVK